MSDGKVRCVNMFCRSKLNLTGDFGPITEADCKVAMRKVKEDTANFNHRAFVAAIKAHPERLKAWDCSESFDDYARRVEAGE